MNSLFPDIPYRLLEAERLCTRRGERFTPIRRAVLEALLAADGPVKAYDLLEVLRERGRRITPATLYRTLDFLLKCALVHRVNALNAYVPCTGAHENYAPVLLICPDCRKTEEVCDRAVYDLMRNACGQRGMFLQDACIEVQGTCGRCSSEQASAPSAAHP